MVNASPANIATMAADRKIMMSSSVHQLPKSLTRRQRSAIKGSFGGIIGSSAPLMEAADAEIGEGAFMLVPVYHNTVPDEGTGTFGILVGDQYEGTLRSFGQRSVQFDIEITDIRVVAPSGIGNGGVIEETDGSHYFDAIFRPGVEVLCATHKIARDAGAI